MKEKECCKNQEWKGDSAKALTNFLGNIEVVKHGAYGIHWHVKGAGFLDLHNFSEEVYTFLNERYDVIGERIIQLGVAVPVTLEEQHEAACIKPLKHCFINTRDGWQLLKYYLRAIVKSAQCVKNAVDNVGDVTTSAILDEDIVELEKFLWLAKASCPCNELPTKVEPQIKELCELKKK